MNICNNIYNSWYVHIGREIFCQVQLYLNDGEF